MTSRNTLSFVDIIGGTQSLEIPFNNMSKISDLKDELSKLVNQKAIDIAVFLKYDCLEEHEFVSKYNINSESLLSYVILERFSIPSGLQPIANGRLCQTFKTDNKDMIIKQYRLQNDIKLDQCKLLIAEIISYYKLSGNPHVVQLKGIFKSINPPNEVKFFIGLENMDKGNLEDYIKLKGKLNEKLAIDIIKVVVGVLVEMHERKIIHRNIRCASIFLNSQNQVKLASFGFSKYQDGTTTNELLTGLLLSVPQCPINWMAPEILANKPSGLKVDIWSVGITLIEMLTGHTPLEGLNETAMTEAIKEARIPFDMRDRTSEKMERIINLCLRIDPNTRPQAKELLNLLL